MPKKSSNKKQTLPSVSFVIATYNSGWCVEDALKSIKKQDYSKNKVEIIFADGGSKDNTLELAKKYGVKVLKNEFKLGEPGFALGCEEANGDLVVFLGHDNQLVQDNWIQLMIKPFMEADVTVAFPHIENRPQDSWLTKYVNRFTDPFNHFVYGYANNPLTFDKVYRVIKRTKHWIIFDFDLQDHPILAFDQGLMLKKEGFHRDKETWYCDILPILDLIKEGKKFAYVPLASNYHVTLNKGVRQFIKKHQWAIDYNLSPKKTFGIFKQPFGLKARKQYISLKRKMRMLAYPFYGISFFIPILRAGYMFLKDREREWFYHPFITFISAYIIWKEAVRVLVFKRDPLTERY
ncbi:glycosyltransferase family 2 protein [Candidatus Microgenomates bacterium]|jgi:glycosyltransferase involved in cell wall biosynthesis|nr:MAG: glycosyltransferase family 2 protein [Candidatus Microgenomates bacterium]